jgi:hypothetical protein
VAKESPEGRNESRSHKKTEEEQGEVDVLHFRHLVFWNRGVASAKVSKGRWSFVAGVREAGTVIEDL